ncbi:MAG: PD40 domain-containing protein [Bacteroidetes bacterium]|nr:PD40 domain-containing protein [Bacteroidota bacterium]
MKSFSGKQLSVCFTELRLIIIFLAIGNSTLFSQSQQQSLTSRLQIIDVYTKEVDTIYTVQDHFEAPNWTLDGQHLIFNSNGKLYRIPITGGEPELIPTGFANRCNNDHVLSPDGSHIAISHHTQDEGHSLIYTVPVRGGTPKLITPYGPSYLHGWSPDSRKVAFVEYQIGKNNK